MPAAKRKRNLSPTPRAGSRGYDVVIGARRKHFESRTAAHRYGLDQQNKGVHAVFVIADSATGKRETFKRGGAKNSRGAQIAKAARRRHKIMGKRNPEAGAASLYEMFHGAPSEGETVVHEDLHIHEHLGELGVLGGLKVRTVSGYDVTLEFVQDKANNPRKGVISKVTGKTKGWIDRRFKAMSSMGKDFAKTWLNPRGKGPVILCSNEVGDSMYLRSGDQALDLDKLHLGGEFKKDSVVIGEVWLLGYLTEKSFDDWKNLFYVHGLGDEDAHPKIGKKKDLWDDAKPPESMFATGKLPMLIYDRLSELLAFSGGVYKIKAEGIVS